MKIQGLPYLLSVGLSGVLPLLAGCDPSDSQTPPKVIAEDPTDIPIAGVSAEQKKLFFEGDAAFDAVFLESDGLGPNYIRTSCGSCHAAAGKGPGSVQKMVMVKDDGITPDGDQSALLWGSTVRPYFAGGAQTGLLPPSSVPKLKLTTRVGLATFGRGYLEAIDDREI